MLSGWRCTHRQLDYWDPALSEMLCRYLSRLADWFHMLPLSCLSDTGFCRSLGGGTLRGLLGDTTGFHSTHKKQVPILSPDEHEDEFYYLLINILDKSG